MKTILIVLAVLGVYFVGKKLAKFGQSHYKIIEGKVYYCRPVDGLPMFFNKKEIEEADVSSFEVLKFPYAKDENYVYRYEEIIPNCDPGSFAIIGSSKNYSKDKDAVFYGKVWISDQPAHFQIISPGLAKDQNAIFRYEHQIEGADVHSFEVLGNGYYKDKGQIYMDVYYGIDGVATIPDADPESFNVISSYYAKDAHQIYCKGKVLENVDVSSFKVIDYWAFDKNTIWEKGYPVKDIDLIPATIKNAFQENLL